MSGNATVYFLPWLRRGVSASITSKDDQSTGGPHAGFEVTLGFNAQASGAPSLKELTTISLYGPGEVTGLDHQAIIRTLPKPGVTDFEANLFPMIEFDQPDLPWRYTPARASREDRLRPWISLIVLRADEIERLDPVGPDRLLPAVTVKDASDLPDLDQSGAWAHVHVSGYEPGMGRAENSEKTDDSKVADAITKYPHSVVSRLLCPRRLGNLTEYTAFLVPTFERGRRSGLGLPADEVDSLEKAWMKDDRQIQLPFYYMWSFKTGPLGDFEYLASILDPYELGSEVGTRKMDVGRPGLGLPHASGAPMEMDGALGSVNVPDSSWADGDPFINALVDILNLPGKYLTVEDPKSIVTPPLYGQTYANRDELPHASVPPISTHGLPEPPSSFDRRWFWKLNTNPCRRVASGLGTRVIQSNQQHLMASAWDQVEAIRRANREIRFHQLSMEVSFSSYRRNIRSRETDAALPQTQPLHNRIAVSEASGTSGISMIVQPPIQSIVRTAGARLRESPIPWGVLQSQWRRKASRRGSLGRRQGRREITGDRESLKRMAAGQLKASQPPRPSTSTVSFSKLKAISIDIAAKEERESRGTAKDQDAEILSAIKEVRDALTFKPAEFDILIGFKINGQGGEGGDELDAFKDQIVADLEPRKNIAGSINKRLTLTEDLLPCGEIAVPKFISTKAIGEDDSLQPIMRAPEFPKPTYNYLKEVSQEWLLPGVGKIPQNSISLLKDNQAFVEAFMVGLNHEMGRELLWNGYPTDRRGTYFRQFWDSSGIVSNDSLPPDPEDVRDIKLINKWETSDLGGNSARKLKINKDEEDEGNLILLIRGELLKRYPNTMIYAAKAKWSGDSKEIDLSVEEHPIFSGTLEPDISFFGFNLKKKQALGDNIDAGWFFILQEQPSEPRFGLDVALSFGQKVYCWQNISWGHLVDSSEDLSSLVYIDLNSARPEIDLNSQDMNQEAVDCRNNKPADAQDDAKFKWKDGGSSDIAYITYQPPVRVAIHAERMLKGL